MPTERHITEFGPTLHTSTFEYLKPTSAELKTMERLRAAAREYADALDGSLPDGPDKTFILRSLRTLAMWVNVSVTRCADGRPRAEALKVMNSEALKVMNSRPKAGGKDA